MHWFDPKRVPAGKWPFLSTVRVGLLEIQDGLVDDMDFTEGSGQVLVTGEMQGYRHAVMRRVIDLAQSIAVSWNAGLLTGSAVSSRSLLETLAIFHSFLTRSQDFAKTADWQAIRELLLDYVTFSADGSPSTRSAPPRIGRAVKSFIQTVEPGKEKFWDQICDIAHPNGRRMVRLYGAVDGNVYRARAHTDSEPELFVAVYNVLHSCCWLIYADLEFEILLEEFRLGGPLPANHDLVAKRTLIEQRTAKAVSEAGAGFTNSVP